MIRQASGLPGEGMAYSVMDYQNFLWRLLCALTEVRLSNDPHGTEGGSLTEASSLINRGLTEGYISAPEFLRLNRLLRSAALYSANLNFPDARNAGPYMPTSVWFKRHKAELAAESMTGVIHMPGYYVVDPVHGKSQTLEAINEKPEPVPAPAAPRELRLLCVLRQSKLVDAPSIVSIGYLPIHTMHRVPPRAMVQGKWSDPRYAGLYLRETHATEPTAEVLERCARHRQTNALRAATRTVRTGGVSA
ncbi:Uncharacterised protein [Ectopseudomonas mendocina]|nr:Uncharacterised protein [Pseudomonas mendocina]